MLSQAWVMCLFPVASYLTAILVQKVIQLGLRKQEWTSQEMRPCCLLCLPGISYLLLFAHLLILLLFLEDSFFLSFSLLSIYMAKNGYTSFRHYMTFRNGYSLLDRSAMAKERVIQYKYDL